MASKSFWKSDGQRLYKTEHTKEEQEDGESVLKAFWYKACIVKFWQAQKLITIVKGLQLINRLVYPFWGLDNGAIQTIVKFWQAKQLITIVK